MKLKFQDWLDKQKLSETVNEIFAEAIICYKSDAYRASMVLSYIGFLTILKERMLRATNAPVGITTGQWAGIISAIQDDEKWDAQVRDATQMKIPAPIFLISDDLRQQIIFWKNRRNDCAHFKPTHINYYHIEAFWGFVEDNLSKLVVNGSFGALKNKIQVHFDVSLTPPQQDFSLLVLEIDSSINHTDLPNFFIDVHSIFSSFSILNTQEELNFYNEIFKKCNAPVKTALANFFKANGSLMIDLLRVKPERISDLNLDVTSIRSLWYSTLFSTNQNDFGIYTNLLSNGLIPATQIQEANEVVYSRITWNCKPNNEFEKGILERNGFFDLLKKVIFDERGISDWGPTNNRANLISYYIENYPLTEQIVRIISSIFSDRYNPHDLRDALNRMFRESADKKAEFIAVANTHGVPLPVELRSLI